MVRSKLCAHTCTTRRRPIPDRGPSRLDGRVKPRRELRYRRSLIYKLPVLRWSGATARYSRLYVPVETSTPPCRRSKLHIIRFAVNGKAHSFRCSSAPAEPASLGFVWIGERNESQSVEPQNSLDHKGRSGLVPQLLCSGQNCFNGLCLEWGNDTIILPWEEGEQKNNDDCSSWILIRQWAERIFHPAGRVAPPE